MFGKLMFKFVYCLAHEGSEGRRGVRRGRRSRTGWCPGGGFREPGLVRSIPRGRVLLAHRRPGGSGHAWQYDGHPHGPTFIGNLLGHTAVTQPPHKLSLKLLKSFNSAQPSSPTTPVTPSDQNSGTRLTWNWTLQLVAFALVAKVLLQ